MNRRLRVLTLTAFLAPGGTSGRILGMVRGFDRSRIDQRICLLYDDQPEIESHFGTTRPLFKDTGIPITTLGLHHPSPGTVLPPAKRLRRSLDALRQSVSRLAHLLRSDPVDVIDAHMVPSILIAGLAGAMTRTPAVATEYGTDFPAPIMFWPLAGRLSFDLARAVVTDSRPRAADIQRWLYRRRDKVRVIPNGIEPPRCAGSEAEIRRHFGIREGELVVTQISTLRPHKGHRVLLDAAKQVLDQEPNVRFLVVGFTRGSDREYLDELHAQADRLRIADKVYIGPYPGEIGDVWQVTDIHAHATLLDSLPNAIIEGMSLGKPAVVTAVGGIPDLVTDGETGLVVPPNEPRAFAGALLRVIRDREFARRLGDAARVRYCEGYRAEDTARKLESLFLEMAAS